MSDYGYTTSDFPDFIKLVLLYHHGHSVLAVDLVD